MHSLTVDGEGMAPTQADDDVTDDVHLPGRNSGMQSDFSSQISSFCFVHGHKLLSFLKKPMDGFPCRVQACQPPSFLLPGRPPDQWRPWLASAKIEIGRITQACLLTYLQRFHHQQKTL
ncbi:hypothetical protein [Polaromonas sp. CG_9.11]|uniref:hypothetical protein n=1 Tax=Polaromonas sp. CG_9.11 TaxID=2787730 RepID=UPI0018C92786|nr:hypothetical protein [Polaromonas sp. CG_9.11]MBG6076556.1 hypothetical protein [Polaromonas sp. CG_9.11]